MVQYFSIPSGSGNAVLNNASDRWVSRWLIDVTVTGTVTFKVQKRLHIDQNATGSQQLTAHAYADTWYTLALSNTPVAAGTTQAAAAILDVDAAGCDVQIVYTTNTGTLDILATPLFG